MARRNWVLFCVALGVATTIAGSVFAQQAPRPDARQAPPPEWARPFMEINGFFGLLQNEKVQKELNLTEEQKSKIRELVKGALEEMRERAGGMESLTPEQRRERFQKLREQSAERAEKARKQLLEILSPGQLERLKQLRLQIQGLAVFTDPEVASALQLTEEQKQKLRQLHQEVQKQTREVWESARNLSREEREAKRGEFREKMQQIHKEAMSKALDILTPEQKEKFEKMQGEKFDFGEMFPKPFRGLRPDRPPRAERID